MSPRRALILLVCIALAGCCPWAEWKPCRALVTVQDANGQPLDATVIILKGVTLEEFSRTDCPGSCIVEVPDLFHNGEWSGSNGLVLRAEAAGKQPLDREGMCQWDGMRIDGAPLAGALALELVDSP